MNVIIFLIQYACVFLLYGIFKAHRSKDGIFFIGPIFIQITGREKGFWKSTLTIGTIDIQ